MKVKTEKIKNIIEVSKNILASHKKFEKYRDKLGEQDLTIRQIEKTKNLMEIEAEWLENGIHELHCLAVECGIAQVEPLRYGEVNVSSGTGWQNGIIYRRKPNI